MAHTWGIVYVVIGVGVIAFLIMGIHTNDAVFQVHQSNGEKLEALDAKIDAIEEKVDALLEKTEEIEDRLNGKRYVNPIEL